MLALIRGLIYVSVVYTLAIFWSSIVLLRTIIRFVRNPSRYRYLKPRPDQPEVLKEFRHGFVNLYDGAIRLHYAEAGDPHRPLLLCLHGFPEFWYSWRHQLREFQNDYHVVALDLRGYGQSSKPKAVSDYYMEKLVEDVRQTISALGKGKCYLAAHDWGGAIAWRFTLRYPQLVEKLVIFNCPHPKAFQDRLMGLSLKQWLRSWYMFFFQCPYLPEIIFRSNDMKLLITMLAKPPSGCTDPNAFTEQDIEAWKYTFQQPGAMTGPINFYRAIIPRLPSAPPAPAEQNVGSKGLPRGIVQPPTLIVWGTNDIALETEMSHSSLQYCQKGTLRLIEGASHWVQQDRPEMCNQFIRDFLRE